MFYALRRRPWGRLFYWLLAAGIGVAALALSELRVQAAAADPVAAPAPQSGPATTTVADTVFMADGTAAVGDVVIIWTPFITAGGTPVTGGSTTSTLGAGGALSVALVPNAGATPAGTYYTVVYQLGPGQVRTEFWVVPATSPANLAAVRVAPGAGLAGQAVSLQYVNTQLAGKANDSAVVHLSGAETISGSKTFSTSPGVPTPTNTGDVANKAYVDSAVSTVGGGAFLPTAGGTMTGPITLPTNPISALQAATKGYVDTGLATKANLVSGLVPPSELGSGMASSGTCLLGNGTWGLCGTGSGNVSTAPSGSQVIAQPTGTQFAVNNFNNIRYVTGYNWTQSPTADLTATGSKTITLAPCPVGIDTIASDFYAVHIDVQGTPEDDLVTGGTCTSGAASGTILITTTRTHAAGYTLSSSSQGAQEASNAAAYLPTGSLGTVQTGVVVFPPGEYTWTSTVYIHQTSQMLDLSGAIIDCKMAAACLYLSTPALGATGTNNLTVQNFRGRAMIPGGGFPMIEDNANGSRLLHITTRDAPSCTPFCSFSNMVKVDNDQNFLIDGLDDSAGPWNICNATNGCSVDVLIAGSPFAGTGVIQNSNFTGGCGSNYVNDQANNTLSIKNSVMQAWNSYAVQFGGSSGGGLNPELTMDHVYMEGSSCTNYLGLTGNAGILNEGGTLTQRGGTGASAAIPFFKNTGTTQFEYYVVVHSSTAGTSLPIFAGYATMNTALATDIPVTFYQVGSTGTITYDLLRISGTNTDAPTGTGNFAVATAQTTSICTSSVCTIHDTANSTPGSYAVQNQTYIPQLFYWPMAVVLTTATDNSIPAAVGNIFSDRVAKGNGIVVADLAVPHIYGAECIGGIYAIAGMTSCSAGDSVGNSNPAVQGTLFQSGPVSGGMTSNLKGRVIFTQSFLSSLAPTDLITVVDSNPIRTSSNTITRPTADTADSAICSDAATASNAAQLCLRAPGAISEYINSLPDGVHFLERLTASAKTVNVPLTVNGNLTATGTVKLPVTGTGSQCLHASATGVLSGTGTDCGVGTVNTGAANQVALYSGAGTAVSGDSTLTDNGGTLTYSGGGGISAASGSFSGNLTVNGQLLVAGPWMVSSPIPGTAMAAAGAGTSALGISNDGNFYISANAGTPQQVATTATSSFFTNLFQEDPNTIEERNGTVAEQELRVYSTYTNSSTWKRISMGTDSTDGYAAVRSESSPSGGALGLGFWVNSGLKWVIDPSNNLKPFADDSYNIGTFNSAGTGTGLRPATIYVGGNSSSGSGFELGKFASESYELCNDATTGTVVSGLAVLTTGGCAAKPAGAVTSGAIGIVIANAGTSGIATLARTGSAFCSFDGSPAPAVGDFVVPTSSGTAYQCHDAGSTRPTGTQILGRVLQAGTAGSTVQIFLDMPGSNVSNSLTAAGTGSCTAGQVVTSVNSGAPTCATVTSSFVDSSIATTSTLVSGNYAKASGASGIADSGVAAGPYAAEWVTAYRAGTATAFNVTGTKIELWGTTLTFPMNTSTLSYNVTAADTTSNTYDLGIYSSAGTLVAHTGAIAGSTAMTLGAHSVSWSGTNPKVLQPGKYYVAITTSCTATCATLSGDGSGAVVTFLSAGLVTTAGTQGTLDGTITVPGDSYTWGGAMISFIVR